MALSKVSSLEKRPKDSNKIQNYFCEGDSNHMAPDKSLCLPDVFSVPQYPYLYNKRAELDDRSARCVLGFYGSNTGHHFAALSPH